MSALIEVQGLRKVYRSHVAFEVLPSSLVHLGDATPLKHLVLLIQDAWLGPGWNTTEMLVVGAFLAGAALLTLLFARRG